MHDKPNEPQKTETALPVHPLKELTADQFAALGGDTVVFVRPISGHDLAAFVPQAAAMPEDAEFTLIMSADGSPLLVTDSAETASTWLDEHTVQVALRH